jgi:hypothetical protein
MVSALNCSAAVGFGGANGRAHRAELRGLAARVLEGRARVGVDEVTLLDVDVAHPDEDARVLSFQESSGNSACPEVDALARVLGDLRVDDDVGELQAPAGSQDPVDLREHGVLVRHEVDDAV